VLTDIGFISKMIIQIRVL